MLLTDFSFRRLYRTRGGHLGGSQTHCESCFALHWLHDTCKWLLCCYKDNFGTARNAIVIAARASDSTDRARPTNSNAVPACPGTAPRRILALNNKAADGRVTWPAG